MIKSLAASLTFIALTIIGSSVSASDFTAADLKIDAIEQTLEVQLERIRNARENAQNQTSLAKMRIAERLRLSSEETDKATGDPATASGTAKRRSGGILSGPSINSEAIGPNSWRPRSPKSIHKSVKLIILSARWKR